MTLARNRGALGTSVLEDVQRSGFINEPVGDGQTMKGPEPLQLVVAKLVLDQAVEILGRQSHRPTMGVCMLKNQLVEIVEISFQ